MDFVKLAQKLIVNPVRSCTSCLLEQPIIFAAWTPQELSLTVSASETVVVFSNMDV
jgi:hypothetical protein